MLPFLIEMSSLYELFVAEWLEAHLPTRYRLRYQEPLTLGGEGGVHFKIDMVIYDRVTDTPVCVLDAKYKAPDRVDNADLNQVVVYAKAKRCQRAYLVYPAALSRPANVPFDDITVQSATFSLGGDLDASGQGLLAAVLGGIA
jgi:5-methylcytosine-specific restriction enzyme subunit McrC